MKKSIEKKIKYRAIFIYLIVFFAIILTIGFIYSLRNDIRAQKNEVSKQYAFLSLTNDFVSNVMSAQTYSGLYLTSKNNKYRKEFEKTLDSIKILSDSILLYRQTDSIFLVQINNLLRQQLRNSISLNKILDEKSPIEEFNEKIQSFEPAIKDDSLTVVNIAQDTIIQQANKKGFFKRLGSVFNPKKDSIKVIITQRRDTVKEVSKDSANLVSQVSTVAIKAQLDYENRIKNIERSINNLITANNETSLQITSLLLGFHRNSITTAINIIEKEESNLGMNSLTIIIGGILILVLIMFLIWQINLDINRAKLIREELENANENIKSIMESRHSMLLSISHDIKSPLSSIQGNLELLKINNIEDKEISSMESSVEHINSLLSNLLEFSALEQGKLDINNTDINIKDIANKLYSIFYPLANKKSLELIYSTHDKYISCDALKIKQIASNLISNAIKYTKKGYINYSFKLSPDSKRLLISVKDSGVGINANKQDKLFTQFTRIKENNNLSEGNGLGLYVVKGLVDLLNGEINFSSWAGKGTTIICEIPVKVIDEPTKISNISFNKTSLNILIFEDDPTLVKILEQILTKLGHTISYDAQQCDLIITDMDMGDVCGLDIVKKYKELPIILITGRQDYNLNRALSTGFIDYISKPFTIQSIDECLSKYTIPNNATLLDDWDESEVNEIMGLIKESNKTNLAILLKSLDEDDFNLAQSICHKLVPIFKQLKLNTDDVIRMDIHKDKYFGEWKTCVERICTLLQAITS